MGQGQSKTHTYQTYYETLRQNQPIDMQQLDPYEVLGLSKQFTWEELVAAYRRVAKTVHPDKGGSEALFHGVTYCFKKLAQEYKMKEAEKPHHVLKQNFSVHERQHRTPTMPTFAESANFQDKFNQMFEEHRLEDEDNDHGYGHMMEKSSKVREDIEIPKVFSKFQEKKFHETFERQVSPGAEVIVYKEPEPMLLAKKLQFTELGGKTDDYSTDSSKKTSLQYTDYMKAYTTQRLVDPRAVQKRKDYKTVQDYESERASATDKKLSPEELRYQKEKELYEQQKEDIRLERLKTRDDKSSKHYEKVNQLFLNIR